GVTTVRDLGSPLRLVLWLRGLASEGRIDSPRILTSGPILSVPGGYPLFMPPLPAPLAMLLGQLRVDLSSPRQAMREVDALAERGVDVVKAMYTGADYDDARTPMPLLSDVLLRTIAERAHHHGLPVAVHQVWRAELDRLLELPFDTLEHLSIDAPMTPGDVERIVVRGLPVSTTLMTYGIRDFAQELLALVEENQGRRWAPRARQGLLGPVRELARGTFQVPYIGRRVIETGMTHQIVSLGRLREAGARVIAGTDQGGAVTPCGCISWELRAITRAGFSAAQALRMATSEPAAVLGLPELAHLAPGHPADLILTRGNPAEDLGALERVDLVVRDGRIFHRASH
ncbi:MAG: amidohydrolase family protein, partial [Polyangia bacterium]|nr:amidohydrolase family protein [Polyangia bacterium]